MFEAEYSNSKPVPLAGVYEIIKIKRPARRYDLFLLRA